MEYRLAYNTGDTPVVIDAAGHTIGGGEHGLAFTGAPEVKALVDSDALVYVDVEESNDNDRDVTATAKRVGEVEARRQRFAGLSRAALHASARSRGLSSEESTDGNLAALLALDPEAGLPAEDEPAPTPPTPDAPTPPRPARSGRRNEQED